MSVATPVRIARDCAEGRLSPHVALMSLLWEFRDVPRTRDFLASHTPAAGPLRDALALLDSHRAGCERIASMLNAGVDSDEPARTVEEGIAFCERLFDWSVQQSEESSVAMYSLGSAEVLEEATREVVDFLGSIGALGRERAVLQIGCGIGRIERAIAGRVGRAVGIDVAANMVSAAERRCAGIPNVRIERCSGRDLRGHGDGEYDLVYAVDSFPYLFQSGLALVEKHFAEARRVLRTGGDFVVLNLSYRGDDEADRADANRLAAAHGFDVRLDGTRPFALWDGLAFHFRARG